MAKLDSDSDSGVTNLSLLGKWLPREGGAHNAIAGALAAAFYPEIKNYDDRMRQYRKSCSRLGRTLEVVEQKMCGGQWRHIVLGRLLTKARKAFLNEINTRSRSRSQAGLEQMRYPLKEDRMVCRKNLLDHLEKVVAGEVVMKGADVVYPHEIVSKLWQGGPEDGILQAQCNTRCCEGTGRIARDCADVRFQRIYGRCTNDGFYGPWYSVE